MMKIAFGKLKTDALLAIVGQLAEGSLQMSEGEVAEMLQQLPLEAALPQGGFLCPRY